MKTREATDNTILKALTLRSREIFNLLEPKNLKYLFPLVLLLNCSPASAIDGEYDCDGKGLRIVAKEVDFHSFSMKACGKQGVIHFFKDNCEREVAYVFFFDSVTLKLTKYVGSYEETYQCRKLR